MGCRLQSDCGDCSPIAEIAVRLWRLPSGMSGMRDISEQKANALNFLNPVLSTNQRPRFWALNQWEASILGPPILTDFSNQTAISAIHVQSPQSDCNPPALQSDCGGCSSI